MMGDKILMTGIVCFVFASIIAGKTPDKLPPLGIAIPIILMWFAGVIGIFAGSIMMIWGV